MLEKIAPRGWNSWDCYGAAVTEEIVKRNADFMAKYLKEYGWEYVVVDIQWSSPLAKNHTYIPFTDLCMDEYARLIPAPNRFPSSAGGKGFAPLADYVHARGLKFGIHILRGIPRQAVHANAPIKGSAHTAREIAKTASICQWNTDMYGVDPEKGGARAYYDSIFALYASWGVDFVKCDDICRELPHEEGELVLLSDSMRRCGREMLLSLSPGPALLEKAELYKQVSHMWRITDDFWDEWKLLYEMFERCEKWSIHSGAGHWPDADMLPIGPIRQDYGSAERTQFTKDEQITLLTLWSIFRSPLMIGGEMTGFDDFTMGLLTNRAILGMHAHARHAHQVWRRRQNGTEWILWTATCANGGQYLALFNAGEADGEMALSLADLEIYAPVDMADLWSGQSFQAAHTLDISVKKHGARAFLATPVS